MVEKVLLTVRGEAKMRARLKRLREVERPQNVRDIEEARAHGDLSENAEYHAAKEKQGLIEIHLREAENKLGRAVVIDPTTLSGDRVVFGATVELMDLETEEIVVYQLVGTEEADPTEGRISYTSPLGKAILGRGIGDDVVFRAPKGTREYSIEDIRFV